MKKIEAITLAVKELGLRASAEALQAKTSEILENHALDDVKKIEEQLISDNKITRYEARRLNRAAVTAQNWPELREQFQEIFSFDHYEAGFDYACKLWTAMASSTTVSYIYVTITRKSLQRRQGKIYDLRTHRDVPGRNMIEPIPRLRAA